MESLLIRQKFIEYFQSKKHVFLPSSPMVQKDDPTLLFVNAGMNQFKSIFLGENTPNNVRVVNSQKCLRVSGKHNDLEEVGHDTYHHTMFEMLGNWSFGDYFKREAIDFAWNFLTHELGVEKERLYVTFFKGDVNQNLAIDLETKNIWTQMIGDDKVVEGDKKDNFWEMGQVGPCGPSTEIHIDLRSNKERKKVSAIELINKDHPEVVEIWNIVFIEFNRIENKSLELLPNRHVDTGMGFERLCMILQNKKSTYDTDLFSELINAVSRLSHVKYGIEKESDIAIRVIVDHIRAIAFAIADGQFPSNTGAGYVIRRILRRAVRYGYTYLQLEKPFLHKLIDVLAEQFKDIFPEIDSEKLIIKNLVEQEEKTFLKTLGKGLDLINSLVQALDDNGKELNGLDVFRLYDTYGFPPDLTNLILKEKGLIYNQKEFDLAMTEQKNRSRDSMGTISTDWIVLNSMPIDGFVGYGNTSIHGAQLVKYRKNIKKDKEYYHLVFNQTPFYPESGGQVGDVGFVKKSELNHERDIIKIIDTFYENNLIIHVVPVNGFKEDVFSNKDLILDVNKERRLLIERNHSATHLLHYHLRLLLGLHVEQKGSFVGPEYLRFDFSHTNKIDCQDLNKLEEEINNSISSGLILSEFNDMAISEAKAMGALSLFGEKYKEHVRVIQFGDSIELCGGTHVNNTAQIGFFKIISESSVSSGIRRIEAVTSRGALIFCNDKLNILKQVQNLLKSPDNIVGAVKKMIQQNKELGELGETAKKQQKDLIFQDLDKKKSSHNDFQILTAELNINPSIMKDICFNFINKYNNILLLLSTIYDNKLILNIAISKQLVEARKIDASVIINQITKHINGKGGGQNFFAAASGKNIDGVQKVFSTFEELIKTF